VTLLDGWWNMRAIDQQHNTGRIRGVQMPHSTALHGRAHAHKSLEIENVLEAAAVAVDVIDSS